MGRGCVNGSTRRLERAKIKGYRIEIWNNINVATLRGKEEEMVKLMKMRQLNMRDLVETRMKGCGDSTWWIQVHLQWRRRRNTDNREEMGVGSILEDIARSKLKWYGHVMRMGEERLPKKYLTWVPEGNRPTGRQRKRWIDG